MNLNKSMNSKIISGALLAFILVGAFALASIPAQALVANPNISLSKVASSDTIVNGASVSYTYNVTNTGDINLTVNISDDKLGDILAPTLLTPGESNVTINTTTITTTDTSFTNNATATGFITFPDGTIDTFPFNATASATVTVTHPGEDSCGEISSPGVYVLETDLTNSSTCIEITSNDVIFDGNGHSISGTGLYGTYGVYVHNSSITLTNITVKNLNVTNWSTGIFYYSANNGNISNSNASNNWYGINLEGSSNNTISSNNVSNQSSVGIVLVYSNDSTLSGNNASNNTAGIGLESFSSNNTLSGNNASNNIGDGIELSSSSNNTLSGNNANSNNYVGINLSSSSSNNTLSGNTASNNNNFGIILQDSNNNTIYNSYFNNTRNANDNGINIWNTTKTAGNNIIGGTNLGGNFWSDYTGVDTDGDGLGDALTPYNSSGNIINGGDYLPLTIPFKVMKDFRDGVVDFKKTPAQLGTLLPQNGSNYNVSYVLNKKDLVSGTSPKEVYGVGTVNGIGVVNVTVNDTFKAISGTTQFNVNGVDIVRYNTTTKVATVITKTTQITSASVNNAAGTVNLTIRLNTPLASDENLMVYIKFATSLKGKLPNYADFVNTAIVTTNLGTPETATATINFV